MEMDETTRQLMLRVCDGDARIPPIVFQLFFYRRCHEIFEWLVKHHFTGDRLVGLLREGYENSPMRLGAFVISRLERADKMRPVEFGKDWLPRSGA